MSTVKQAEIDIRISSDDPCWQDQNRTIHVTGEVASAMELLLAAGPYGLHKSKVNPDVPARLDQLHIPYRFSSKPGRGTGNAAAWMYLNPPKWLKIAKVEPVRELVA